MLMVGVAPKGLHCSHCSQKMQSPGSIPKLLVNKTHLHSKTSKYRSQVLKYWNPSLRVSLQPGGWPGSSNKTSLSAPFYSLKCQLNTACEVTDRWERTLCVFLTDASLSKRAKSSLSVMTSSWAVHWEARLVKPSMSANRILRTRSRGGRAERKNIVLA